MHKNQYDLRLEYFIKFLYNKNTANTIFVKLSLKTDMYFSLN